MTIDVGDDIIVVVVPQHIRSPADKVRLVRAWAVSVGQMKVCYTAKDALGDVRFALRNRVFVDSAELMDAIGCASDLAEHYGVEVEG